MAQKKKIIKPLRGEVYWVDFDPSLGSEIKKIRPALILQNDIDNKYSPVTIVAAISSSIDGKVYLNEVFIKKFQGGLKEDSLVLLNQIKTIDKKRLIKRIGVMDQTLMMNVDRALEISLGLVEV